MVNYNLDITQVAVATLHSFIDSNNRKASTGEVAGKLMMALCLAVGPLSRVVMQEWYPRVHIKTLNCSIRSTRPALD